MGDSRGSGRRGRSGGEVSIRGGGDERVAKPRLECLSNTVRFSCASMDDETRAYESFVRLDPSFAVESAFACSSLAPSLARSPVTSSEASRSTLEPPPPGRAPPFARVHHERAQILRRAPLQRARAPEDHAQSLRARQSDVQTPRIGEKTDVATRISTRTALTTTTSASDPWKLSTLCTPGAAGASARTAPAVAFARVDARRLLTSDAELANSRRTRRACSA